MTFPYRPFDHAPVQHVANLTALASVAALDADLQHNPFVTTNSYHDHDLEYGFQDYPIAGLHGQAGPWIAGQQQYWSHAHPAGSQPSYQTGLNPEMYATAYTAYSGMPPDSNVVNREHNIAPGSAVSLPTILEFLAIHADKEKSLLRGNDPNGAMSTQRLLPQQPPHPLSRASSYQDQASSQDFQQYSEDMETSEDSWEESSEDISAEDSALVNLRSTQALAIDERKAYLLRHFVNNIRPCLSISEPSLKFDGSSTWGEVLPSLALSCPGLLHGLMAASALHLAVLHGTNEAVPMKHFMVASKRLHKLLGTPSSRHQLQTLSLCLLLSWYEVMNGDHARWIMHLGGASSFLLEHVRVAGIPPGMLSRKESIVNEELIEKLTGFSVSYTAESHQYMKDATFENDMSQAAEREWKARLDLFWWYIKMDVFHALLSGDQVLLPYQKWGLCPPRGRIGSISQVHATIDHLWLVLGRLADFGGRDRFRKQRQIVVSGGQWKPPPNFLQPTESATVSKDETTAPGANEGRSRAPKAPKTSPNSKKGPPMNFYGMMPPPTIPPSMLSSFHVNDAELRKHAAPQKLESNPPFSPDLRLETKKALAEHAAISEALEAWKTSLGSDFDSLPSTPAQADCPFSPSLKYSDPLVACMWSLYYLGRILLRRYHPHSPPAMIVSAGVNAPFTHEDAEKIGRINAGLLEHQAELAKAGSINPTLVAALQELSFVLMFAGVQYRSAQQRLWTIDNLLDLARSAGWKSAYAVASALETAWSAQGEMGKGPPYERTLGHQSTNDASRNARISSLASRNMFKSSESEHESRFVSHDRGLITTYADARAYWAIGVLSSDEDVQKMFDRIQITSDK